MNKLQSFNEMGRRMINRGLPPKYVHRFLGELQDHQSDLSDENRDSDLRLGDLRVLEHDAVTSFRSRSLFGSRPLLGFLGVPIPLAIAVWAGYYALAFLMIQTIYGPLDAIPHEKIATSTLIFSAYCLGKIVPPAITAALLSCLALRSGRPLKWLLISTGLLSLFCFFGFSSQVMLPYGNSTEGTFSLSIPSWSSNAQLIFSQLLQSLTALMIGVVFLWYSHRETRAFAKRMVNASIGCEPVRILLLAVSLGAFFLVQPVAAQTIKTENLRWPDQFGNRRPWRSAPRGEACVKGDCTSDCDEGCCDCPDSQRYVFGRLREFSGAWNSGNGDDLGITEFDVSLDFGTRLFKGKLLVSPSFGMNWLTGPTSTDLPSQLYDLRLDVTWSAEVNDRFRYKLQVSPGIYSDFRGDTETARMIGSAVGYYDYTEHLQLVFGATAFPEEDQGITAIGGLVWAPFDHLIFEMVFPAPRISWRFSHDPAKESWLYFTGDVTRVSYNVQRTTGADDFATYEASRLALGVENRLASGMNFFAEGGYAFDRALGFDSQIGNLNLADQAFVRVGMRY